MNWLNNIFNKNILGSNSITNLIPPEVKTKSQRDKIRGTATRNNIPNNFCSCDESLVELQNDTVANNCYYSLWNLIYSKKWQIIGDKNNFYTDLLKQLDIDNFLRQCFWEMLMRYDNALILFDNEGYPYLKPFINDLNSVDVKIRYKRLSGRIVGYDAYFKEEGRKIFFDKDNVFYLKSSHGNAGNSAILRAKEYIKAKTLEIYGGQKHAETGHYPKIVGSVDLSGIESLDDFDIGETTKVIEETFKTLVSKNSTGAMFPYPIKDLKMLQPTQIDFDKLFNTWNKEICYAFFMPPSFLGINQQANFKTEQDRDNLIEGTIAEYRIRLENVADYILKNWTQPGSNLDLKFTFGDPITDEKLKIRQQLQNSFTVFVQNKETIEAQGFTFDNSNLESLGFVRKEKINLPNTPITKSINNEELNNVYDTYKKSINMTLAELTVWKLSNISLLATESREALDKAINLLSTKKEDWGMPHIKDAKKAIAYINRGEVIGKGKVTNQTYPLGRNEIALKNWGYKLN